MAMVIKATTTDNRVFDLRTLKWYERSCPELLLHWGLSDQSIKLYCFESITKTCK